MRFRKELIIIVIGILITLTVRAGSAFSEPNIAAPADPYTIQSLNTPYPEFVSSGDAVLVKVTGPSTASVLHSSVRLNGKERHLRLLTRWYTGIYDRNGLRLAHGSQHFPGVPE